MAEKQETTAVESEENLQDRVEPNDEVTKCPILMLMLTPKMQFGTGECMLDGCAWWLEGQGRDREGGCSIRVLAEACSAFMIKVRKGKVFGR